MICRWSPRCVACSCCCEGADQPSWSACARRNGPNWHVLLCDSGRAGGGGVVGVGGGMRKPPSLRSSTVPSRSAHTFVRDYCCSCRRSSPLSIGLPSLSEAGKEREITIAYGVRLARLRKCMVFSCLMSFVECFLAPNLKFEIVYNNTSKNRLLSMGPPFCYAQLVVGLLSVR
jgi:hypothetical protein